MTPDSLRAAALQWHAEARPAVVVQVASARGSVPRDAGTRMLVAADAVLGSIGGGHLELRAIADARMLLASSVHSGTTGTTVGTADGGNTGNGANTANTADTLRQRIALGPSLGQCCGGALELLFTRLTHADPAGWPQAVPRFSLQLYGAGHVGRAIAQALAGIDCRVQWIDERAAEFPPEPPGAHLAPHIQRLCVEPVEAEVAAAPPGAFYLVLTHSHALDMAISHAILQRGDFGFFGLIGSQTKRARFEHRLLDRGIAPAVLARMACPIGMPGITGKEPAVVAASAVAQLLSLSNPQSSPQSTPQSSPQPKLQSSKRLPIP